MRYIVGIIFALLILSCRRDSDETEKPRDLNFRVFVVDYSTGIPISGAKTDLYVSDITSVSYTAIPNFLKKSHLNFMNYDSAQAMTTSTGVANFDLIVDGKRQFYQYFVEKEGYQQVSKVNLMARRIDSLKLDTIYLDKPSFIEFNLTNISSATSGDTLYFEYLFYSSNRNPLSDYFFRSKYFGASSDTIKLLDTFSYRQTDKVLVRWKLNNTGQLIDRRLDLEEFATKTVQIDY